MSQKYAYLGIKNGACQFITVDDGDQRTAECVSDLIRDGCSIERVTIEVARKALFEAWPRQSDAA